MIVDFNFAGVLVPGLVVVTLLALIATMATMRLVAAAGISRLFAHRPLVELATFVIIHGLLMQYLPLIGPQP